MNEHSPEFQCEDSFPAVCKDRKFKSRTTMGSKICYSLDSNVTQGNCLAKKQKQRNKTKTNNLIQEKKKGT